MVGVRLSRTEACRPETVESFPLSGGLVLRPPGRNRLVVLNEVAAVVWELFTAGMPATEITACLVERFRPDLSFREADPLPAVRAPEEGASCLAALAALVAGAV